MLIRIFMNQATVHELSFSCVALLYVWSLFSNKQPYD